MGMYSTIIEDDLKVRDELRDFNPDMGRYWGAAGKYLYEFLVEKEEAKFYGYHPIPDYEVIEYTEEDDDVYKEYGEGWI